MTNALRNGAGNGSPLSSRHFLQEIDAKLPQRVNAGDLPPACRVMRVYRDVEAAC